MKTYYIVWNQDKSEGFITDDYSDAIACSTGYFDNISSTIGSEFHDLYAPDDDEPPLIMQTVELPS